jgi:hypothetical protein
MKAIRVVLLVACASAALAGPAAKAPHDVVVWNTGNGWTSLAVEDSGLAHYDFHPSGFGAQGRKPETIDMTIDAKSLAAFEADLKKCRPCSLKPSKRLPVPEEGHQKLHVDLPGTRCDVELLSNDWSEGDAGKCSSVLDGMTERVRKSKHPD